MLKRKRRSSHDTSVPHIRPYAYSGPVWSDAERKQFVETGRGWLDADGVFYEMPEGKTLRLIPLGRLWSSNRNERPLIIYAPEEAMRKTGIRMQSR